MTGAVSAGPMRTVAMGRRCDKSGLILRCSVYRSDNELKVGSRVSPDIQFG